MPIEFHCEHCSHLVKAPDSAAGSRGKCPHCQAVCFIPAPAEKADMYDLAPVDDDAERRRVNEDKAAKLLHNKIITDRTQFTEDGGQRTAPRSSGAPGGRPAASSGGGGGSSGGGDDIASQVQDYLLAMARSQLEDADRIAFALTKRKTEALAAIQQISADQVASPELAALPAPVLNGFLRQLRAKL